MERDSAPERVLLKLSGSVFGSEEGHPFDRGSLDFAAAEIAAAREGCPQIAIVVGAGNVIRGASFCPGGSGRIRADYAGMLATAVNALVLRECLEQRGVPVMHYGAFPVPRMIEVFEPERCARDLEQGRIVVLAGGTGNPLLTTDTAAALRAVEIGADLLLKATRVDGVYSGDPEKSGDVEFFPDISYRQVLERRLGVMDLTAVSLCMEYHLPVRVFNYAVAGNIRRAASGESVGTVIGSAENGY